MATRAATGRAVALVVAVALAALAAFLIWRYVQQADQRAYEGAELVDVFVASGGIPEGMTANTAFSQQLIETDRVPRENLPTNAVGSLEQISGLAATAAILPGEILLTPRWADPTLASANVEVPPNRVGMSLQVEIPQGISGYLVAGDRIAIIGHLEVELLDTTVIGPDGNVIVQADTEEDAITAQSKFIATDVQVLAVGRRVIVTTEEGDTSDEVQQTEQVLVTVAVTPEDAEKLSFIVYEGQMYFTLLPDDYVVPTTPGRTADTVFQP